MARMMERLIIANLVRQWLRLNPAGLTANAQFTLHGRPAVSPKRPA
jgi:hypothetical protein